MDSLLSNAQRCARKADSLVRYGQFDEALEQLDKSIVYLNKLKTINSQYDIIQMLNVQIDSIDRKMRSVAIKRSESIKGKASKNRGLMPPSDTILIELSQNDSRKTNYEHLYLNIEKSNEIFYENQKIQQIFNDGHDDDDDGDDEFLIDILNSNANENSKINNKNNNTNKLSASNSLTSTLSYSSTGSSNLTTSTSNNNDHNNSLNVKNSSDVIDLTKYIQENENDQEDELEDELFYEKNHVDLPPKEFLID